MAFRINRTYERYGAGVGGWWGRGEGWVCAALQAGRGRDAAAALRLCCDAGSAADGRQRSRRQATQQTAAAASDVLQLMHASTDCLIPLHARTFVTGGGWRGSRLHVWATQVRTCHRNAASMDAAVVASPELLADC